MVEAVAVGTVAGFGAVSLTVLGFAWNVVTRSHERIERELFELRKRMRELERDLASVRPLVPLADRMTESFTNALEEP